MGLACCHTESSHPPILWQSIPNPSGAPPLLLLAEPETICLPTAFPICFFSLSPRRRRIILGYVLPLLVFTGYPGAKKIPSRKKKGVYEEVKMNGSQWNNPSKIVLKILFIGAFKTYIVTCLRNPVTPATLCTFTASLRFKCGHIIKSGDFNVTFFSTVCAHLTALFRV